MFHKIKKNVATNWPLKRLLHVKYSLTTIISLRWWPICSSARQDFILTSQRSTN